MNSTSGHADGIFSFEDGSLDDNARKPHSKMLTNGQSSKLRGKTFTALVSEPLLAYLMLLMAILTVRAAPDKGKFDTAAKKSPPNDAMNIKELTSYNEAMGRKAEGAVVENTNFHIADAN